MFISVSTPQCNASHDPFVIRDGDSVVVWCMIQTRGNWNPIIEWTDMKQLSILSDSSVVNNKTDDGIVQTTSRLQMVAEQAMQETIYSCTIRFGSIRADGISNATIIPDYIYNWKSQPLNVICMHYMVIICVLTHAYNIHYFMFPVTIDLDVHTCYSSHLSSFPHPLFYSSSGILLNSDKHDFIHHASVLPLQFSNYYTNS